MTGEQRAAIVRIDALRADGVVERGTGFVVSREHVLTCLHVVADSKAAPPAIHSSINVRFGEASTRAVEVVRYDAVTDWALLKCPVPAHIVPLSLRPEGGGAGAGAAFWTWGFADLNSVDGKTFKGEVRNYQGTYANRAPAIELYSEEVKGTPVHGLSGAPCLVDDSVVGVLRVTLEMGVERPLSLGTLYATPIAECCRAEELSAAFVNPYQGLKPFSEERSEFFFGRQSEVTDLLALLSPASRLLSIVGASGSGKSSLVLAGLVPAIRAGRLAGPLVSGKPFHVVKLRPGPRPLQELAVRLHAAAGGGEPNSTRLRERLAEGGGALSDILDEQLATRGDGALALVVVDQLEELFTLGASTDERDTFLGLLVEAAGLRGGRTYVIVTLRSDFLGPLGQSPSAPGISKPAKVVVALGRAELKEVIERPAARVGLRFEDGLVDKLLDEAGASTNGLPLLQFSLERLWREREVNLLTAASHLRMGGLSGAIARRADEIFDRVPAARRSVVEQLLVRMVQPGERPTPDARRMATHAELSACDPEYLATLHEFIEERLLVSSEGGIEVAHEAILTEWKKLRGWIDAQRKARIADLRLQKAFNDWRANDRADDQLLRGSLLRATLDDLGTLEEQPDERVDFLLRSLARSERDVAAWLGRFSDAAVNRLLDELMPVASVRSPSFFLSPAGAPTEAERLAALARADRATRILIAAGPARSVALNAAPRLMNTLAWDGGSPAGDCAAAAIGELGLSDELVASVERLHQPGHEAGLAWLRNRPGTGFALYERLPKGLRRRVRRLAAMRLMTDHRTYLVTLVAVIFLIVQVVSQTTPFLDTLIGTRQGSMAFGAFELVSLCGVAAYSLLRNDTDGRRVGLRSVLFIAGGSFFFSLYVWALFRDIAVIRDSLGKPIHLSNTLASLASPWLEAIALLPIALVFRGQGARRFATRRILGFALLASATSAAVERFGWQLCNALFSLGRDAHFTAPDASYQGAIVRASYSVLVLTAVLVAFREIWTRFQDPTTPSDGAIFRRWHLALFGAVAIFAVLSARGSSWIEGRLAGSDRLFVSARRLAEDGNRAEAIRFLRTSCAAAHLRSCQLLSSLEESEGDKGAAFEAASKACSIGGADTSNDCMRAAQMVPAGGDHDARARELFTRACERGLRYGCDQAAALWPEDSDERLRLRALAYAIAVAAGAPQPWEIQSVESTIEGALERRSAEARKLAATLCERSPRSCWLLARSLMRDAPPDSARAGALLDRACEGGYVVACVDRVSDGGVAAVVMNGAVASALLELCAEGDQAAIDRAPPAVLRQLAERQWARGQMSSAISTLTRACEQGDTTACVEWGKKSGLIQRARDELGAVPARLLGLYPADRGVTLMRLARDDNPGGEALPGGVGYSFARASNSAPADVRLVGSTLRITTWPREKTAWARLDVEAPGAPPWTSLRGDDNPALPATIRQAIGALTVPELPRSPTPPTVPTVPTVNDTIDLAPGGHFAAPATYLIRMRLAGSRDLVILLHVEERLPDGSVVLAWKPLPTMAPTGAAGPGR